MRRARVSLIVLLAAAPCALAVTDAERIEVYHEFRAAFDARHYEAALPVAQHLVALTEEQYGAKARELANPLTNLGTTYHRMGNHAEAEKAYRHSIEILEAAAAGPTDPQLLAPLHGLGVTYLAQGEYDAASLVLRRAVDLSRNLNGLFNPGQLMLLEPLIRSYIALGDYPDAEQEHQYTLEVAESAYGKTDLRLLGPLDRLARWYEFVGRYSTARALHARALSIAERDGTVTLAGVDALRGIARTYRLEYLNGPEEESRETTVTTNELPTPERNSLWGGARTLNTDGEHALQVAISVLEKQRPVNHGVLGETIVDLGDWYLSAGEAPRAQSAYRSAWKELQASGSTVLLAQPRQIAYRPPAASVSRTRLEPRESDERFVEVHFTVTPEGRTTDVAATTSDAPESLQKAVVNSVKRARYGPRLENGEPVAARDVSLRERVVAKRGKRD